MRVWRLAKTHPQLHRSNFRNKMPDPGLPDRTFRTSPARHRPFQTVYLL